jgi:RHS repeat-associated protein
LKISDKNGVSYTPETAPVKTTYTFTNREWDADAGMYYYRARYYDPGIGRFISEDVHPGVQKSPLTVFNKYAYVMNNPLNHRDPSGMFLEDLGKIVVAAVIVAAAIYTGGAIFAAVSGSVGSAVAGSSIVTSIVGFGSAQLAVGAFAGAVVGTVAAIAAGATIGAIIGAAGYGAISALSGGSFEDGASEGAQVGFILGAIGGGIGAASGLSFSEAPGTFGSFLYNNPYLFVTPGLLYPFTGDFKVQYECGEKSDAKDVGVTDVFSNKKCAN